MKSTLLTRILSRRFVQLLFFFITIYIGIEFYQFVAELKSGGMVVTTRPAGVEAFLPISALLSLKYLLFTGIFNTVHPAALILFLIICFTAILFKKGFCSWICPVGYLSDLLAKLHRLVFKRTLKLPKWPDRILRVVKYVLLGFFLWTIFFKMPVIALEQFIYGEYNRFADIKMLEFFTNISNTSLIVIVVLSVLSAIIPYFWCRYLCPYGALLNALGLLSLGRIKRDLDACVDCKKCDKVCPSNIQITGKPVVNSMECSTCMRCVDACPEKDAIGFSFVNRFGMTQKAVAILMLVIFFGGIGLAKMNGLWQTDTTISAYRDHVFERPKPRRAFGNIDPAKRKRMMEAMRKMKMRGGME